MTIEGAKGRIWCSKIGWLRFVSSRIFRCSLDYAKHSFYRAANAIFGKIGRIASEDGECFITVAEVEKHPYSFARSRILSVA